MRYPTTTTVWLTTTSALLSLATASSAPVVNDNPHGIDFSATLSPSDAAAISGAFMIAAAPDGQGVSIQISLFNLPDSGNLSYGIYTGNVVTDGDCSTVGGILNPYNGVTGSRCRRQQAACEVGALSDKHGPMTVQSGGSGTGYFAAVYVDEYLSLKEDSPAYVGNGSIAAMDSLGTYILCANLKHVMPGSVPAAHTTRASTSPGSATTTTREPRSASAIIGTLTASSVPGPNAAANPTVASGFAAASTPKVISMGLGIIGVAALFV